MSEVLKQPTLASAPDFNLKSARLTSYLPAAVAVLGAAALTLLRMKAGPEHFSTDGALMMIAAAMGVWLISLACAAYLRLAFESMSRHLAGR